MLTEKDYCDYETCVALMELGMRITSRKVYSDRDTLKHSSRGVTYTVRTASAMGWVIAIPLYEAQKFLRERKNLNVNIRAFIKDGWYYTIQYCDGNPLISQLTLTDKLYKTYEEALSEGIKEAVKILKDE